MPLKKNRELWVYVNGKYYFIHENENNNSCILCMRLVYEHICTYICLVLGGRTTNGLYVYTMKSEKLNRCMVLISFPYECKYV